MTANRVYVATHDGGYDGQSLPLLAFPDRETAMKWALIQTESYNITEVPIYPELPLAEWFNLEAERDPA